jgi:GGDEF domain-containing protein
MADVPANCGPLAYRYGGEEVCVEAADAAMYESKHAGRNRVTLRTASPAVAA